MKASLRSSCKWSLNKHGYFVKIMTLFWRHVSILVVQEMMLTRSYSTIIYLFSLGEGKQNFYHNLVQATCIIHNESGEADP